MNPNLQVTQFLRKISVGLNLLLLLKRISENMLKCSTKITIVKVRKKKHTNMAKHKIKSFPCLFLALCALLLVDFPDKSNVASPVKPQKQHDGINIEEEVK